MGNSVLVKHHSDDICSVKNLKISLEIGESLSRDDRLLRTSNVLYLFLLLVVRQNVTTDSLFGRSNYQRWGYLQTALAESLPTSIVHLLDKLVSKAREFGLLYCLFIAGGNGGFSQLH